MTTKNPIAKCFFCNKEKNEEELKLLMFEILNHSYHITNLGICPECLMDYSEVSIGTQDVDTKKEYFKGLRKTIKCISCGKEAKKRYVMVFVGMNHKKFGYVQIFQFTNICFCLKCAKKEKYCPTVSFIPKKDIPSDSIPEDDFISGINFSDLTDLMK